MKCRLALSYADELLMLKLLKEMREDLRAIRLAVTKEEQMNAMVADLAREAHHLRAELAELRKTKQS